LFGELPRTRETHKTQTKQPRTDWGTKVVATIFDGGILVVYFMWNPDDRINIRASMSNWQRQHIAHKKDAPFINAMQVRSRKRCFSCISPCSLIGGVRVPATAATGVIVTKQEGVEPAPHPAETRTQGVLLRIRCIGQAE
jgi:hypothetical protein